MIQRKPRTAAALTLTLAGAFVASLTSSSTAWAIDAPWQQLNARDSVPELPLMPDHYQLLQLDGTDMAARLAAAPPEGSAGKSAAPVIELPLPDGGTLRVAVEESPVMSQALAEQYPQIRTYRVRGVNQPNISGRLDLSPRGFHGLLDTPDGTLFIDPREDASGDRYYVSYYKRDYRPEQKLSTPFSCGVEDHQASDGSGQDLGHGLRQSPGDAARTEGGTRATISAGNQLSTYRIAIAATGEYTAYHGGVNNALAAIVTTLNRANQIFERDFAVRMTLIDGNDQIIFTDANADPYSNFNGFAMLAENQETLDNIIGIANYDVGHVFSTGGGGVAQLQSVCSNFGKARGVTGSPRPVGDPFDIDYVAHEIGHQLGALHTFNGTTGSCGGGNRSATKAYEPGSGSTIMAYSGICGEENLQFFSDALFHIASIEQAVNFTTNGGGAVCAALQPLGNNAPTADAGADASIPAQTPFELTGTANDADGDNLSYVWEQYDLGNASNSLATMSTDDGTRPLFRSQPPSASPTRSFPRLAAVLSGENSARGETLPTTNRELNFRFTVRDGNGGVASEPLQLDVVANAGPFRINIFNQPTSFDGGSQQTLFWQVAGTADAPISCANVDVLFSSDGGQSFPLTLLENTPNDGDEVITLPNINNNFARLKVKCSDNVFFDINDADLTINAAVNTPPVANDDALTVNNDGNSHTLDVLANDSDADVGDSLTIISVTPPDQGGDVNLVGNTPNNTLDYTPAAGFSGIETFDYTLRDGSGAEATATVTVTVNAAQNTPPTAVADNFSTTTGTGPITLDVLDNDYDADDGDTLTISALGNTNAGGSVSISGNGPNNTLSYTPAAGFTGIESFSYTISDSAGATASAQVKVSVDPVDVVLNTPPTAVADNFSTTAGTGPITLDVLDNDYDADDGDTLTISALGNTNAGGSVSISGNGPNNTLSYTPAAGFTGIESFSYTISDSAGATASTQVSVSVGAVLNTPPSAVADDFSLATDSGPATLNVLANDYDADAGDNLTIISVGNPAFGGSVSISGNAANNRLNYSPAAGFSGVETFGYTIKDSAGAVASAQVRVVVSPAEGNQEEEDDNGGGSLSLAALLALLMTRLMRAAAARRGARDGLECAATRRGSER